MQSHKVTRIQTPLDGMDEALATVKDYRFRRIRSEASTLSPIPNYTLEFYDDAGNEVHITTVHVYEGEWTTIADLEEA